MTNRALWLCATRTRDKIADYGHAMPIGLGKLCISGGIGSCDTMPPVVRHARGARESPTPFADAGRDPSTAPA